LNKLTFARYSNFRVSPVYSKDFVLLLSNTVPDLIVTTFKNKWGWFYYRSTRKVPRLL